ncbi:MAG TPA: hypothetical protein PLS54_10380, partial [Syntrophomonadaceae bacterium]|nr:hypothetical protein [Syntrophomonadaceae bacterium]
TFSLAFLSFLDHFYVSVYILDRKIQEIIEILWKNQRIWLVWQKITQRASLPQKSSETSMAKAMFD